MTPTLPFIIGVASGNDPLWVYYLCVLSINVGGIANAIQYICHEGFLSKSRTLSSHQVSNSISNSNTSEQLSETSYNSELPVLKKEISCCASICFNTLLSYDLEFNCEYVSALRTKTSYYITTNPNEMCPETLKLHIKSFSVSQF
ncbi:17709_t:CDS:2 [Racocetra fulgida]|uniref:17709_t:CDS:1 n=1 Tax=Racocetra fulgida TaxID=60492 RepID=A0A9N8Z2K3_9GLOM|nr:17709_t:CDS:2 [Racocetra fulgida]